MLNCVAAIQFDEERQRFILVSGNNRVEIRKTKALKKFVNDAPEISADILAGLTAVWFPDDNIQEAEFTEVKEVKEDELMRLLAEEIVGQADNTGGQYGINDKIRVWIKSNFPDLTNGEFKYLFETMEQVTDAA